VTYNKILKPNNTEKHKLVNIKEQISTDSFAR